MKDQRMELRGDGSIVCGLLLREYNYPLSVVTKGKLQNFRNFAKVFDNYPLIVAGIMARKRDLTATATNAEILQADVSALDDLRCIVNIIVQYVDRCKMLGVAAPMTPYES
ncbi:hypothetical protein WL03_22970 [Burkholderia ubonensis]|uniref:hypothetical protein n=1 Tax=Burkholderia ubonensis TaxID=101571 RepID=UPI00076067B1|nr:hypothetical protein [Burkholderia ubonensis]KVX12576.1 hypothetical protein WL03_22970 [Burkholderia ubonensis]